MLNKTVKSVASLCLDYNLGEQGWRSGESTRLPPMWPGFDSRTRRHMWVEFVAGSLLCSERFFSGYSGFPLSQKPTFPNSNSTRMQDLPENHFAVSGASWVNIMIYFYLFIYLIHTFFALFS